MSFVHKYIRKPFHILASKLVIEMTPSILVPNQAKSSIMASIQITTLLYQVPASRFTAKLRGSLITLIYNKVLRLPSTVCDASGAVTLIATDIERICEAWDKVVGDLWAGILQLGIALWLLRMQIGLVCLAPVLLTFGKSPKFPEYIYSPSAWSCSPSSMRDLIPLIVTPGRRRC